MTIKKKHLLISLSVLIALYIFYEIYPSGFQRKIAEGPSFLSKQLSSYLENNKVNSDPYAASRYRPEDPLYAPLLAIQYGDKEKAETLLAPLVEKGNSEAMFWLAEITYGQSIYSGETAGELFIKAAKLGNPYAAIRLDSRDIECTRYMESHCSEEWGEKGRVILKKLADTGDARAGYALFLHDVMLKGGNRTAVSEESFNVLAKASIDGVKYHYYYPLMELASLYRQSYNYPIWVSSSDTNDNTQVLPEEDREVLKSLYKLPAKNNDAYAINLNLPLASNGENAVIDQDYTDSQILRTLPLLSKVYEYGPAFARKSESNSLALIQGAAWAIVDDFNRNGHNFDYGRQFQIYEYFITNEYNQRFLDKNDLERARELSKQIIETLTPVIYLDENQTDIF
ncbi:hypothetical protein G5S52_23190 [Grimontia sp. S25]|uniref:Sel1 repeat family protein n=1 Tax=Grimontia sedimenti TaxID=2711294 RepID=A0A6M1RSG5_9GAMM|nr:hypothetical protein [Grimontia sedimenti]NGO00410.1 hypothetical protein [Grimontia sedimenti]